MIFSKIYLKAIVGALILVAVYAMMTLFVFLPHIEEHIITLEERIGEAQLQKTVQIVKSAGMEMTSYADHALVAHKKRLESLTETVWQIIAAQERRTRDKSEDEVSRLQQEALALISELSYGDSDYYFVSDHDCILISHPYLQGKDFSNVKDLYGNFIVPPMVEVAKKEGAGFTSYWWKKNNDDPSIYEKLSYAKAFEPWEWVVGTGVYIDNIDKEIDERKAALISRLKAILKNTKVGQSGYIYIFDADGNMIVHPNSALEGTNFKTLENPGTGRYIFDDLINAYHHGDQTLYYLWDTSNDRDNYVYEKVSWIDYDPYFKWYICSSGYVDEFRSESSLMRQFVIYTAMLTSLLITGIGLYFTKLILKPVIALSQNAKEVINGNFQARYRGKIYDDETGVLATQHNLMLDTINEHIETLDQKVQEKTKELSTSLKEKEMLLKEIHHRVKNNLFVISGILGLQAFQNKQSSVDEFVETIQNRIQSIAMAHEMLYKNDAEEDLLDVRRYITTLVDSLLRAYVEDDDSYRCHYEIEPLELSLDQVVSCGLIINELVTNTIKYAFKGYDDLLIIALHRRDDGSIELMIQDNGKGIEKDKEEGIGLELVRMSVTQLEGTMQIDVAQGTKITIVFAMT